MVIDKTGNKNPVTYFLRSLEGVMSSDPPIHSHICPRVSFQVAVVESRHCFVQRRALDAPETSSHETGWRQENNDTKQWKLLHVAGFTLLSFLLDLALAKSGVKQKICVLQLNSRF